MDVDIDVSHLLLPGEELRPVEGYEGVYAVSSYGRILRYRRCLRECKVYWLKLAPTSQGYRCVTLHLEGERRWRLVHDIVIRAFKGPPPSDISGEYEVNHDDLNKDNNYVTNLFWLSVSEHAKHTTESGVLKGINAGSRNGMSKLSEDQAEEIRLRRFGGESAASLAGKYGMSYEAIRRLVNYETYNF